jgi:SAM-dependent methyltransferase
MTDVAQCRSCGSDDLNPFLSLGKTPLADALVTPGADFDKEERFALDVAFCANCSLVQLLEEVPADKMFVDNYLYFSSFSDELLRHSRENVLRTIAERQLGPSSLVVEVASNDGYLLKNFAEFGVPVLGIDPAPDQAAAANAAGIPTLARFFGSELAAELVAVGKRADVIIANNVMAHVPGLNDVMAGVATLLADNGTVTIENPYVRDLIDHVEFDTIYHEHLCYHSCTAIDRLAERHGLHLNHVDNFPRLHGGTLRWHLSRGTQRSAAATAFLESEAASGLTSLAYYEGFAKRVEHVRTTLRAMLEGLRRDGKTIAAYGAAAKGATLVNTVGLDTDLVDFVVDRNVHKQGLLMPGTHQPILDPSALVERRPDYVLLLAWNFKDEIIAQQQEYVALGGQFIVPVPEPTILTGTAK